VSGGCQICGARRRGIWVLATGEAICLPCLAAKDPKVRRAVLEAMEFCLPYKKGDSVAEMQRDCSHGLDC